MTNTAAIAIAGVVVVVAIVIAIPGLKRIRVWLGKRPFVDASTTNGGASAADATAGGTIRVKNEGEGGASAERARAGIDIEVSNRSR